MEHSTNARSKIQHRTASKMRAAGFSIFAFSSVVCAVSAGEERVELSTDSTSGNRLPQCHGRHGEGLVRWNRIGADQAVTQVDSVCNRVSKWVQFDAPLCSADLNVS